MNEKIIALADAVAKVFDRRITQALDGKEVLLIPADAAIDFKIPDRKMDKDGWKDFTDALKFRHKLEAHNGMRFGEILICPYGYLSGAPLMTDADIDEAIKHFVAAETETETQYADLMKRLHVV